MTFRPTLGLKLCFPILELRLKIAPRDRGQRNLWNGWRNWVMNPNKIPLLSLSSKLPHFLCLWMKAGSFKTQWIHKATSQCSSCSCTPPPKKKPRHILRLQCCLMPHAGFWAPHMQPSGQDDVTDRNVPAFISRTISSCIFSTFPLRGIAGTRRGNKPVREVAWGP